MQLYTSCIEFFYISGQSQKFLHLSPDFSKWGIIHRQQICTHLNSTTPLGFIYTVSEVKVTQLCPTLYDPMDCILAWILQARILEWVAFPFSRGSSQPRDGTQVSHIAGRFLTSWTTREALYIHRYLLNHYFIKITEQLNSTTSDLPPTHSPKVATILTFFREEKKWFEFY